MGSDSPCMHAEIGKTSTFRPHDCMQADLLVQLERQDPARYRATLCCRHIRIARSTPSEHRMLVEVQCMQPRGEHQVAGDKCPDGSV